MAYSLYDAAVTPCAQQLGALVGIIDKAAAHCATNKIEESNSAAGPVVSRHVLPRPPDPSVSGFRHEHRRPPGWRYSSRHAGCGRHQLRRRQKPRRNGPRLREVPDSRTGRRRGGQGYRLDWRRQRPENEGQRLSATVRPAEFLLLCNNGVQHPASSRRTARKAGLPRPGQLALVLRFRGSNHIAASLNLVLRSALARVSKDGHKRDRASGHPSRRRFAPPQDEVCVCLCSIRLIRLVSWNRSTSTAPSFALHECRLRPQRQLLFGLRQGVRESIPLQYETRVHSWCARCGKADDRESPSRSRRWTSVR